MIFIRKTYDWFLKISGSKNSAKFLAIESFLESIFIPIPPDVFLLPMVLAKPKKWFYLASICTIFSILGGIVGYLIGAFIWDFIGQPIVDLYDAQSKVSSLKELFDKYGIGIILLAGFTPLPYKIFTIGSGLFGFNFFTFIICSFISRGLRFTAEAYIIMKIGPKSIAWIEKNFSFFTIVLSFLIILFFIILTKF